MTGCPDGGQIASALPGPGASLKTKIAFFTVGLTIACKPLPERVRNQVQTASVPARASPATAGPAAPLAASDVTKRALAAVSAPIPAPQPVAVQAIPARVLYGPSYHLPNGMKFHGYDCTVDCSGHETGYHWAEDHGIDDPDNCGGDSNSFIEGCRAYAEEHGDGGPGGGSAGGDDDPSEYYDRDE